MLSDPLADDFVMGGELEGDARRSWPCCPSGLRVWPAHASDEDGVDRVQEAGGPQQGADTGTAPALSGLTHYWSRSRRGFWVIKRRTARKRLCRTKKSLWRWCHLNRHAPLKDQYHSYARSYVGTFQYGGIRGNLRLQRKSVATRRRRGGYWLSRRSSKSPIAGRSSRSCWRRMFCPHPRSSTTSDGHAGAAQ